MSATDPADTQCWPHPPDCASAHTDMGLSRIVAAGSTKDGLEGRSGRGRSGAGTLVLIKYVIMQEIGLYAGRASRYGRRPVIASREATSLRLSKADKRLY